MKSLSSSLHRPIAAVIFSISIILFYRCDALPQSKISVDDIANADSTRYGSSSGPIDADVITAIFGGTSPESPAQNQNGVYKDDQSDNCTFYANDGYECVPFNTCEDGFIVTDGANQIDIRSGGFGIPTELDPDSSKCPGYLDVCCRHEAFEGEVVVGMTTTTTTTPKPTPAPYVSRCGRRNDNGIGVRIINTDRYDGITQFGEWPHMCVVLKESITYDVDGEKRIIKQFVSGGSLVGLDMVVTAAHSVEGLALSSLVVRCGEWDTQQKIEPLPHQERPVRSAIGHPEFNNRSLHNDIALLLLAQPFDAAPHIDVICLPRLEDGDEFGGAPRRGPEEQRLSDDERSSAVDLGAAAPLPASSFASNPFYSETNCFATGWGKDKFDGGDYQVVLKQITMDLVRNGECQDRLRQTSLGRYFKLDDSFICAGGQEGHDTCKGDGGGPLACPHPTDPDRYVLAGITSWGVKCGEGQPGVYSDVIPGVCFIEWADSCGRSGAQYRASGHCQDWPQQHYCALEQDLVALKDKLVAIKRRRRPGRTSRIENEIVLIEERMAKYEACPSFKHCSVKSLPPSCSLKKCSNYGEDDGIDLTNLARASANDDDDEDDDDDDDDDEDDPRDEAFERSGQ